MSTTIVFRVEIDDHTAPLPRRGQQPRRRLVPTRGQGYLVLGHGPAVQLRRPSRPGPGTPGPPRVRHVEQAGFGQPVQVEGGEGTADAERLGHLVATHRLT